MKTQRSIKSLRKKGNQQIFHFSTILDDSFSAGGLTILEIETKTNNTTKTAWLMGDPAPVFPAGFKDLLCH